MSEYKNIIGKGIRFLSSNLDNDQAEGQIWYNSTDGAFKNVIASTAWVSAAPVITARRTAASAGTQTANFIAGGFVPPSTQKDSTEEYNGSGWTTGTNLPAASYAAFGAGTLTAGLVYGGSTDPSGQEGITTTLEYDGSSWTSGGALNQKRWSSSSGAGTQTAALCSSGYNDGNVTNSEEYNGSTWTAGNAIDTAKRAHGQCGSQTASVLFGGIGPPGSRIATVEEYDGTNYSSATSLPGTRSDMGASGTQTAALGFAGYVDPGRSNNAFLYDGTSWTAQPNLATAIDAGGGSRGGTSTAALSSTGTAPPGLTSATEEFTQSSNVITAGAWASGSNMNSGRTSSAGFANKDDLVIAGGFISTPAPADDDAQNLVEEYNGASWTAVTAMPTKRSSASGCGASQTSGMVSGGIHTNQTTSVEYDGTNWTSGGAVPQVSRMAAHCGTVPAALRCGGAGNPGPAINETIEYDGSSWTAVNNMPHSEYGHMLVGTQTAAVFSGGHNSPTRDNLYEYDGTNWTTSPATLAVSINNNAGAAANGTQTAAMWFLGSSGTTASQIYNGTSVVTQPSLGTGRYNVNCGGGGTSTAAIVGGGQNDLDATEEFTGETSALNIKTISTS